MSFQPYIEEIITKISSQFQENELAYLALTSKIELPLRDKIAFELHKKYKDEFLICREWKLKDENKSVDRIDLAIIDKSNSNVLCLMEFKAKSVIRYQKEFTRHLADDLIKIRNIAKNDNTELYYVYFNNVISKENHIEDIYVSSVKYISDLNKIEGTKDLSMDNWNRHILDNKLDSKKSKDISINGGKYYNIDVSIETFIYGPTYKSELIQLI